jgi:predicted deacylase
MTEHRSLITATVDYARDGVQTGVLRLPHSHNRSAYGHVPIPVMVAKRGDGPTLLLTGANHGDEYEGPVALMHLMRTLKLEELRGRLIVVPGLNFPAYLAATRVSPIDSINLNRAFPGDPRGTPTQMIADYVENVLMPLADVAMDLHAGGSSLNYLPTLFAMPGKDAKQQALTDRLVEAFAAPRVLLMDMLGEDRMIESAANRHDVTFLTGEFGGAATVNVEGVEVVRRGLRGVLSALEMLPAVPRPAVKTRRLVVKGNEHYIFAPRPGIFEPLFKLGDEVQAGQLAGFIHDPYEPWRAPEPVHFQGAGLALCIRTFARVEPGDCLAHLASDV